MNADISGALAGIQSRIKKACLFSGQSPDGVRLIAVTKTFSADEIRRAYDLGLRHFGENKVQELLDKKAQLPSDIEWHMIGRLQTNKVKAILGETALIHSLDRTGLFDKISSEARSRNIRRVECLLQVNISGEKSKAGFAPEDAESFLRNYDSASPVKIMGLMTMAPLTENKTEIRKVFASARGLMEKWRNDFPGHSWKYLSMGMSGDYEIAVEEGATMVRIGTALFGNRSALN